MNKELQASVWDFLSDEKAMASAIDSGASVDVERNGQPLFVAAVESGSVEVVRLLAGRVKYPERADLGGYTALHALATRARVFSNDHAQYRVIEMFEILRPLGIDPNAREVLRGRTAADLVHSLSLSSTVRSPEMKVDLSTISIALGILAHHGEMTEDRPTRRLAH
ncbi:ankyrin repeat domain-containing protein [Agrobacterium rubi]|nr:ankyrin repeat domain-containing protein [Agrobacterium rubi]NTF23735.1 ankyrin repeat domain-containing protein [Agrobacterium rubi]